jgi:flagellar assembly protein FliH
MSSKRSGAIIENRAAISPLVYTPAPGWKQTLGKTAVTPDLGPGTSGANARSAAISQGEVLCGREKEIQEQGMREGVARARAESKAAINAHRDGIAAALGEFSRERDAYFHQVEGEVVALALAIVRKILRRESQVDPMLLTGLVRVALEKTSSSHTAKLRVHPSQVSGWKEYFSARADLPLTPEVESDTNLEENHCCLETEFGVTDISVETQLKEIEKGLFDLLAQRPSPR